jgi:UDP-2,3-diacylglucosamine hydrolase
LSSVLFASDFHLLPDDEAGLKRFAAFLEFAARSCRDLYLLGDLFDVWIGPKGLWLPGYRPAFAALKQAERQGLRMTLIPGNRDFNLDRETGAQLGLSVGPDSLVVDLFERRALLTHGDAFLTDDRAYQRLKRVLRSRPIRAMARSLPLSASEWLAARLRHRSTRAVARKSAYAMRIVPEAVRALTPGDASLAICGHVHRPERLQMNGVELWTLGAFEDMGWYLEATPAGLTHQRFGTS